MFLAIPHADGSRRFLPICLICLAAAALLYGSYEHARHQADALIAKIPEEWQPYSSGLCCLRSRTGRWGLSWDFSYEPKDYFVVVPTTLNVTLTGRVTASNPTDILPLLKALP